MKQKPVRWVIVAVWAWNYMLIRCHRCRTDGKVSAFLARTVAKKILAFEDKHRKCKKT